MIRLIFDGTPGTVEVIDRGRHGATWRYLRTRRAHTPWPREGAARGRFRAVLAASWAAGVRMCDADFNLRRGARHAA